MNQSISGLTPIKPMRCHLLILFELLLTHSLSAGLGDERWDSKFFAPEFGTINAVIYATNGDLICGGSFGLGVPGINGTQNIACWNGTNWLSLGGGISGTVYALAISGNEVVVGGVFTSVQGKAITNLARWDGTNWLAVGGGVTGGSVRAIAAHSGTIYVGGLFTRAGPNVVSYIASWDGATWNDLGGGMQASNPSSSAVPVQSLLYANDSLYVGGRFYGAGGAGGVMANNVARWSAGVWGSLGTGLNNGVDNSVAALALDTDGHLYVGGSFANAGTNAAKCVATWDGIKWAALAGGVNDPLSPKVNALQLKGSDLYAAGNFSIADTNSAAGLARWDGAAWHSVDAPLRHPGLALASYGSNVVVSAKLLNLMTHLNNGLVQFDGRKWSVLGAGIAGGGNQPVVQTVSAVGDEIRVSGFFDGQNDGSGSRQMVASWNGKGWVSLGNGLFQPTVAPEYYVASFLSTNGVAYAAGKSLLTGNGVAVLSNGMWMDIGAPLDNTGYALAFFGNQLFAGHGNGISVWNGSGWTNVGAGLNGSVFALAVVGSNLYAGGAFTNSGATIVNNIARWDGVNWSPLAGGVNGVVRCLCARDQELFVGGDFTESAGIPAPRAAKWFDGEWKALGVGFNDTVNSMCVLSDGRLFAGGRFTQSGGDAVNFVASWDGTNWLALGSGVNDWVLSIASDEYSLFVGGRFTRAGDHSSLRFARWQIREPSSDLFSLRILGSPAILEKPLRIEGSPGARFALEFSTNLEQWLSLATNLLSGNGTNVAIPNPGAPAQFFRVRSVR